MALKEWPEEGELVVATVKKVRDYGAFVRLEEYKGKEGFIHISEVSSGWVKNIRDFVKENQKIVARVVRVNPVKGQVDLSLKGIREDQKRKKIQQWRIEQKAEKFLELAAKSLNKDLETAYKELGKIVVENFGDLYAVFEVAADEGEKALIDVGIPKDWAKAITEVAVKNIKPSKVKITGYVDLISYAPNGVEIIRDALKKIEDKDIEIQVVGAPRYRITVTSKDYPSAEKKLRKAAEKCISFVEKFGGKGEFHREVT
ncbi:translation initiation factor 2 subunit alpha (aeIF-2a) [Methanothermus fervidus DSM 2088]|uniref:Translation initiation factor 2 subunit alpha n=1 Tax=Methanothermus fervidus (strain ATCC 43054 / DSM 2088 / JCM 10308 / V24 S) TaxID=523846 RepID=E3GW54_METFV|nr:translation initiation factor IF-2 subunit alpha [Methanothermus fervidus]ADP77819.1 translation initiation factor 2 subunit alpha (aeIF-2a) [Methanothermus fervidus DSM 2088]